MIRSDQFVLIRCSQIANRSSVDYESLVEDIIFREILPKLPVKSLLRFRCVSKSWRSLISSKAFIKAHLENTKKNTVLTHQGVMLTYVECFYSVSHWSLRSLFYEPITEEEYVVDVTSLSDNPGKRMSVLIVGSIDGLCCVVNAAQEFFVWNPCTRKTRKLCDIGVHPSYHLKTFGFGFVESMDDYKVLAVFDNKAIDNSASVSDDCSDIVVKLYSLKASHWKTIVGFKHASIFERFQKGQFLNGKVHWLCRRSRGQSRDFIMSFDLQTEEQNIIELPCYVDEDRHFNPTIGVLGGCLSFVNEYRTSCVDVWVLKEDVVHEPWSKVARVPYIGRPAYYRCLPALMKGYPYYPLCVGEAGEILFYYCPSFVVYNPKNNLCRRTQENDKIDITNVHIYTHSLLSPFLDSHESE